MVTLLLLNVIHISAVTINILLDSLHKCHVRTFIRNILLCADALDSGFSLLLQPMVDLAYEPSKSIGVNFLFTIPALIPNSAFCTVEYLTPLKYKLSNHCYQGPIKRDELALLPCQHSEYLLHRDLLVNVFDLMIPSFVLKIFCIWSMTPLG